MKPMLCEQTTIEEARAIMESQAGEWIVEQKVDGVRGTIIDGKLYDRRGADITAKFPEFEGIEKLKDMMLDGELICTTNDFGDIQGRMHLKDKFFIQLLTKKNPARFVLFDVLLEKERDKRTLIERKEVLEELAESGKLPSWIMPLTWMDSFEPMWTQVEKNGWEGVVLKNVYSTYEQRRSTSWRKVKAFIEGTATFVKFEEHPRGITVETEDGRRVVINGALAVPVKHKIIKDGKAECNIQYMKSPLAGSDAWRFPSFRGLKDEQGRNSK